MKVLVIGANGQVGKHIVEKLIDDNHEPIAMIRDTDQIPYFEERGAKTVIADLEKDFKHAYYGVDAVIFAAGSGPHTGSDKTIMIDQEAAIKSMQVAENFGIKRLVMLSSIAANRPDLGPEALKHYLYAKGRADAYLRGTSLDYTIIRPGGLTDDKGTGKVEIAEQLKEFGTIPREDVAKVLVRALHFPETIEKSYDLISGSTQIEQAFQN